MTAARVQRNLNFTLITSANIAVGFRRVNRNRAIQSAQCAFALHLLGMKGKFSFFPFGQITGNVE
jgi:hypothetical protein